MVPRRRTTVRLPLSQRRRWKRPLARSTCMSVPPQLHGRSAAYPPACASSCDVHPWTRRARRLLPLQVLQSHDSARQSTADRVAPKNYFRRAGWTFASYWCRPHHAFQKKFHPGELCVCEREFVAQPAIEKAPEIRSSSMSGSVTVISSVFDCMVLHTVDPCQLSFRS